jgi:hypothetical protein
MKPTVTVRKSMFGKKTGYRALFATIGADGVTAKEAQENCEREVRAALERLDHGPSFPSFWGLSAVVYPTDYGWSYKLSNSQTAHDSNKPTRGEVETQALHHMAQNAWTPETNDADFLIALPPGLRDEVRGWILFQREYTKARVEGVPENECHRVACERAWEARSATP